MVIKKCDRCGKIYESNNYKIPNENRRIGKIEIKLIMDEMETKIDLCDECFSELDRFFIMFGQKQ